MQKTTEKSDVWYSVRIEDWSLSYGFGASIFEGGRNRYDETIMLYLHGTFEKPATLAGQRVTARMFAFELNIEQPRDERRNNAGELTQDRETREFDLALTMRFAALGPVVTALGARKMTAARFVGTKLRYRHAWVSNYWLEVARQEEDE